MTNSYFPSLARILRSGVLCGILQTFAIGSTGALNAYGEQIFWVGDQATCDGSIAPMFGSFHHGNNWLGYVVPGPNDHAEFEINHPGPGGVPNDGTTNSLPRYLYFGDFLDNRGGVCSSQFIPAAHAETASLSVHEGDWTFDLGAENAGGTAGSLTVNQILSIGDVAVGQTGLTVRDGLLTTAGIGVAEPGGANARLTVTSSALAEADILVVGGSGNGVVEITDGGRIDIYSNVQNRVYVGIGDDSHGLLTIDGVGSALTGESLITIGGVYHTDTTGRGEMRIINGGTVSSSSATIANRSLTHGEVVVAGAGSTWTNSSGITVGDDGQGALNIDDGGDVVTSTLMIGNGVGSDGVVDISDGGSTLTTANQLIVGGFGNARLNVENGGSVSAQGELYVGAGNVLGGHSEMNIVGGGMVSSTGGGVGLSGARGEVTISGAGSVWNTFAGGNTGVTVGGGSEGEVTVQNGASLVTSFVRLGDGASGQGRIAVTGIGTTWNIADNGFIAGTGGHGEVGISNGATVTTAGGFAVGDFGGSGDVTVEGNNSLLETAGEINIRSGALSILDGGVVRQTAFNSFVDGALVTIAGNGSKWETAGGLNIRSGQVDVSDGGVVIAAGTGVGSEPDLPGVLNVRGQDSRFESPNGIHINRGEVNITDQATATTNSIIAGQLGAGRLSVLSGSNVKSPALNIGESVTAIGIVELGGAGTSMTLDIAVVGVSGQGELTIYDGAKLGYEVINQNRLYIGLGDNSVGSVSVSGPGSTIADSPLVSVGGIYHTDTNGKGLLTIADQAVVTAGDFTVGERGTSQGLVEVKTGGKLQLTGGVPRIGVEGDAYGEVRIDGEGSALESVNQLAVGYNAQGIVEVTNGGTLLSHKATSPTLSSGIIGRFANGEGRVTIADAGSQWSQDGYVVVGAAGSGELEVIQGGAVHSLGGKIARDPGSSGSVVVAGAGSSWRSDFDVSIGGSDVTAGGAGTLTVSDHGSVQVGETLRVWQGSHVNLANNGRIRVGGGPLPSSDALAVGPGGLLSGSGQIIGDVLVDGGTVSPGSPPGILSIDGSLTQFEGTLEFQIGGPTPGTDYDQLLVDGATTLEGIIRVIFADGFTPSPGQTFDVIVPGGSFNDEHALLDFVGLSTPLMQSALFVEGSLSFLDAPLPGDTDHNGAVDLADLNNVRNHFGASGIPVLGDTNFDGFVDLVDLNNVRNFFGVTAPQAVPEPSSIALLALGAVGIALVTSRTTRRSP